MKLIKFLKKNWLIILIVVFGLFLRLYRIEPRFMYSHDQDLAGWFIRDVLFNKHLRLIGQETSIPGVFIGPVFYYLLIPFYLLFGLSPVGGQAFVLVLSILTIVSIYFVFEKIFNRKFGLIGAFIYSVSFYFVLNNVEVVPTMPISLWSIWFLYSLFLLLKGKKFGYILSLGLIAFAWNISFVLVLLALLIPVAILMSKKKFNAKYLALGALTFLIILSPFLFFEAKHDFQQIRAVFSTLAGKNTNNIYYKYSLTDESNKVWNIVFKNTTRIFFRQTALVADWLPFFVIVLPSVWIFFLNKADRKIGILLGFWILAHVVFFTFSKISLSEYYFNSLNIVWVLLITVTIACLFDHKVLKWLGYALLASIATVGIYRLLTFSENNSGYVERKALIDFIKSDSIKRNYDCVSISYITEPGYDLGYRYIIWFDKLKLKRIQENIPVYTIVFPLSKVGRTDKNFGVLGLVLPDYKRYTEDQVSKNCQGEDANVTDSMILFTAK